MTPANSVNAATMETFDARETGDSILSILRLAT
jgi:hypothetical protein